MAFKLEQKQLKIENTEVERFSYDLIQQFMQFEDYNLYSVEDKLLENFNHAYYQIIYIYSHPLYNDENVETLFETVRVLKSRLKKAFLSFNPQILLIATNCDYRVDRITPIKGVSIIQANGPAELKSAGIISDVYPSLLPIAFDQPLPIITLNINRLSYAYIQQVNQTFNKKAFAVTSVLFVLLFSSFFFEQVIESAWYSRLKPHLFLDISGFTLSKAYQLLTNSFVYPNFDLFTLIISGLVLFQFGYFIERVFGSWRYLVVVFLSLLVSNTMLLVFNVDTLTFGFTPLVYGLLGAFFYTFLVFRRLFAYTFKRLLFFLGIALLFMVFGFSLPYFTAITGAFLGGVIGSFIVGIPGAFNSSKQNRVVTSALLVVLVVMAIVIGLTK